MADEQPIWEEKYKQLEDQYRKDMGLAYQALQQQQPQQQQPEEPLWDTSDPQKLKGQIEDSLRKTVVDTLSPVVTHFSGNQFESQPLDSQGRRPISLCREVGERNQTACPTSTRCPLGKTRDGLGSL